MKKNRIECQNDGKEIIIKFSDGSESLSLESKREGLLAINNLLGSKKITNEEFSEMSHQILNQENLPWEVEDSTIDLLDRLLGNLFLLSSISDILKQPNEPVEIAYFEPCKNCNNHGRIYAKQCFSSDLNTKEVAFACLEHMKKLGHLDDSEFEKVKKEIENSALI